MIVWISLINCCGSSLVHYTTPQDTVSTTVYCSLRRIHLLPNQSPPFAALCIRDTSCVFSIATLDYTTSDQPASLCTDYTTYEEPAPQRTDYTPSEEPAPQRTDYTTSEEMAPLQTDYTTSEELALSVQIIPPLRNRPLCVQIIPPLRNWPSAYRLYHL